MKFATLINRELKLVLCVEMETYNDPTFGNEHTRERKYLYPIKYVVEHVGHIFNSESVPIMFPTVKAASLFLNQVSEYAESFQDVENYRYIKADTLEVILLDDLEGVLDE
jgi:hypothetical protein